ncbi:protein PHLOEM PROTEIN 2-LIKE A9 isoform X1 [Carya illinoinensis]|uniref:Protein PHLOEM PROTEIN 2-LIKE A9-like n=1 Tax=Carya illinoinensis TaxID=32201 RepID=A0A8T1PKC2_CARIL|nr:protein PHLOEM PROTEIN 2-LIKE A9 isoform X1 [Carya illinoinensis]KAG6641512.1 hypothetical protein CIPAW_09G078700 [Carya illinoinensis]
MSTTKPHHDAESDGQLVEQADQTTIFYPRGLNIVWGSDPRYWRLPSDQDKTGPVDLVQVSWLEVTGSREMKPSTTYEIGFKISLTQEAFGWNGSKVYVMAKLGRRGKYSWKRASLDAFSSGTQKEIPQDSDKLKITTTSNEATIYFGMYEVWSGKWKGGLRIHHAYIREAN